MLQKKKPVKLIPKMCQIFIYSEKLNKGWLEVHFVESKTSDVTMNAILNSAQNSTLRINLFFSKNTNKNFSEAQPHDK